MLPYIPKTHISLYSVMIMLGAAAAIAVAVLRIPRGAKSGFDVSPFHRISKITVFFCALYALAFGLAGAKLFYIFGNIKNVIDGAMTVYQLFASGFMFYGGFFGGALGIFVFCKIFKLDIVSMFDAIAVGLPLAQCFGRIGCFCAGCCFGVPTDSAIGVVFTRPASIHTPIGIPLVPTQLIESAMCFLIFLILLIGGSNAFKQYNPLKKKGALFTLYCLLYAAGRFVLEFWRGDSERGFVGALSWSQFIGVLIYAAFAVYFLIRFLQKKKAAKKVSENEFMQN